MNVVYVPWRSVTIAGCLLFIAGFACGREQSAPPKADRIEALINALASPNPKPEEMNGRVVRFPASYDAGVQAKVFAAYEALLAEGEAAFPALKAHLLDKRYCATIASSSSRSNVDVGGMCGLIIRSHVTAHLEQWPGALGRNRPGDLPGDLPIDNDKFLAWLESNKQQKLWEMQLRAIEIAQFQMMEWEPELLVKNRQADPDRVIAALSETHKRLKASREQLQVNKVPLKSKGLFAADSGTRGYQMLGLPAPPSPPPASFRPRNRGR